MGSKGRKPRKPTHSQHLDKVGTKSNAQHEQQLERRAVMDTVGLSNAPGWAKIVAWVVVAVLLFGGVLSVIVWTIF
jgi:hypothetical protein